MAAYKLAIAEERLAELKGRLEEMRQERDRARAGEAAWKAQCEAVTRQIACARAPTTPRHSAITISPRLAMDSGDWVLSGAGLLLALSTVPAGAQQQQPNRNRRRDASRWR